MVKKLVLEPPAMADDDELISVAAKILGIDVPILRVDHHDDEKTVDLHGMGGKVWTINLSDLADRLLDELERAASRVPLTQGDDAAAGPAVTLPHVQSARRARRA